ncbi:hypothetical protein RO3G_10809 [Rhizopus delemar RA 99-880]|uniref:Uncharacterized protein n=1 Tax=Rhizopus delemar (strain RA 99-880 / ATCC MYA-4621 / FGSC 9543 / NRRL 43880) TaxID=246409 RepID=I1CCB8_RHIO9|nr:hypothetical protein RO3G_10809 [Rhizopus delemar RA 99-880]|eukprot:EIE86098.1 hypothetical protein RO3G_10809 [Rhizopus delemar RA 99-880]
MWFRLATTSINVKEVYLKVHAYQLLFANSFFFGAFENNNLSFLKEDSNGILCSKVSRDNDYRITKLWGRSESR